MSRPTAKACPVADLASTYQARLAGRRASLHLVAIHQEAEVRRSCIIATLISLAAGGARAQAAPSALRAPDTAACTYVRCALGVSPAWNGLDVVRGAAGVRVARLGFFWPGDVRPAFAGNDSAFRYAARAVRARRLAALLTDVGGAALGVTAVRLARRPEFRGTTRGVALGGIAIFGLGVPFQFAADGQLSRAVWWKNSTVGRSPESAVPVR